MSHEELAAILARTLQSIRDTFLVVAQHVVPEEVKHEDHHGE